MTVFNCDIHIEDGEYIKALLTHNVITLLQDKIYRKFNLIRYGYSLYRMRHDLLETKKESTEEKIKEHIFSCTLHVYD